MGTRVDRAKRRRRLVPRFAGVVGVLLLTAIAVSASLRQDWWRGLHDRLQISVGAARDWWNQRADEEESRSQPMSRRMAEAKMWAERGRAELLEEFDKKKARIRRHGDRRKERQRQRSEREALQLRGQLKAVETAWRVGRERQANILEEAREAGETQQESEEHWLMQAIKTHDKYSPDQRKRREEIAEKRRQLQEERQGRIRAKLEPAEWFLQRVERRWVWLLRREERLEESRQRRGERLEARVREKEEFEAKLNKHRMKGLERSARAAEDSARRLGDDEAPSTATSRRHGDHHRRRDHRSEREVAVETVGQIRRELQSDETPLQEALAERALKERVARLEAEEEARRAKQRSWTSWLTQRSPGAAPYYGQDVEALDSERKEAPELPPEPSEEAQDPVEENAATDEWNRLVAVEQRAARLASRGFASERDEEAWLQMAVREKQDASAGQAGDEEDADGAPAIPGELGQTGGLRRRATWLIKRLLLLKAGSLAWEHAREPLSELLRQVQPGRRLAELGSWLVLRRELWSKEWYQAQAEAKRREQAESRTARALRADGALQLLPPFALGPPPGRLRGPGAGGSSPEAAPPAGEPAEAPADAAEAAEADGAAAEALAEAAAEADMETEDGDPVSPREERRRRRQRQRQRVREPSGTSRRRRRKEEVESKPEAKPWRSSLSFW